MNWAKGSVIGLFVVVGVALLVVDSAPAPASDNLDTDSLNNLYEYLLQREYTGHVPLADHQVERKAVRSPSLRLRFGRRSDPSFVGDKRAPSTRLRWGKRDMGVFNENAFAQDSLRRLAQRSPSVRLRFGRSDPLLAQNDEIRHDGFQADQSLDDSDLQQASSMNE